MKHISAQLTTSWQPVGSLCFRFRNLMEIHHVTFGFFSGNLLFKLTMRFHFQYKFLYKWNFIPVYYIKLLYEAVRTCPPIRGLRNLRVRDSQRERDRRLFLWKIKNYTCINTEEQENVFTCSLYTPLQMDSSAGLVRRLVSFLVDVHFNNSHCSSLSRNTAKLESKCTQLWAFLVYICVKSIWNLL